MSNLEKKQRQILQQRAGLRLKEAGKGLYLREANKLMSNIEKNIEKKQILQQTDKELG